MNFLNNTNISYVTKVIKTSSELNDDLLEILKKDFNEGAIDAPFCNAGDYDLDDLRDDEILIYPNPTTDIINITAKNDIKIDVINLLGEIIITIENQDQIDLSQYSNGLYILDITYNNIKIQHKIIKK